MFIEIGSFDAKAKLSQLLRDVQRGRRYTITVRGRPVADLVPSARAAEEDMAAAVSAMRAMNRIRGVSDETLSQWITEGRR